MHSALRSRPFAVALIAAIVALTLATSYIHSTLGGLLFTLNAIGYAGLAAAFVVASASRHPFIVRFSWLARLALAGYTTATIVGYLVMGPYFFLGFATKAIEVALLAVLAIDIARVYGGPVGLFRAARASLPAPFASAPRAAD